MNPHQKNKVDISCLNEQEKKLFNKYGALPAKNTLLQKKLEERKYFDSGDYAMSKAGKASEGGVTSVGEDHPDPEKIPHLSGSTMPHAAGHNSNGNGTNGASLPGATSGSPVKEGSFLQRETSVDEPSVASPQSPENPESAGQGVFGSAPGRAIPLRWQQ